MKKIFCIVGLLAIAAIGLTTPFPTTNDPPAPPVAIDAMAPAPSTSINLDYYKIVSDNATAKRVDSFIAGIRFDPTLQTLISFRGEISQVLSQRVGTMHDFLGRPGLDVNVNVFSGFAFSAEGFTGGISLTKTFAISRELSTDVGLYVQATEGRKIDGGIFIGGTIRF